jgi:hypothetical protein
MEEEKKVEEVKAEEPKAEEEKPVEEVKPAEEAKPVEEATEADNKFSLITFILAAIGFALCAEWIIGGIACLILGCISLKRAKVAKASKNPYKVFNKISLPVSIVDIVFGALSIIGWTIWTVFKVIEIIEKAAQ